jgi:hypothetical protein
MSVNHESEEYLIELLRVRDMARVEAKLYRASARHYEAVEQTWRPLFSGANEADGNWDWERKQRRDIVRGLNQIAESSMSTRSPPPRGIDLRYKRPPTID